MSEVFLIATACLTLIQIPVNRVFRVEVGRTYSAATYARIFWAGAACLLLTRLCALVSLVLLLV